MGWLVAAARLKTGVTSQRAEAAMNSLDAELERQFPDVCETQPEVLARHYAQARLAEQAIDYWQRAGDRAAKRSANQEAVAHFRNAIELW